MKRTLKIGVVVDQLLAGGVQLSAIEQVKGLISTGHQATLIVLMRKKYPVDFSYLTKDIPVIFLSDRFPLPFRHTIKLPFFSFLSSLHLISPLIAPRYVKPHEFDILISHGTTTCLTTQALFRAHHIPYLAMIHDPMEYILHKVYSRTTLKYFFGFLIPLVKFLERSFVQDAAACILDSTVHASYIKKYYQVDAHILSLTRVVSTKLPKKRGDCLLSFGRWQREKKPDFLLEILTLLPTSKLIIAGSWTSVNDLVWFTKLVKTYGLTQRVQIYPHYDEELLMKLAKKSRIFVYPHFEAFGLSALEAASLALPIVMPAKSGVTEHFIHAMHGYFPKNRDVHEFVTAIKLLTKDKNRAYRMGLSACKKVARDFSPQAHIQTLQSYINSVLSDQKELPVMAILETCHVYSQALSGGDKLMEPMAVHLRSFFRFEVIVSTFGALHWSNSAFQKDVRTLRATWFDRKNSPVYVFMTYCIRMIQSILVLNKMDTQYIYSSTNLLPDILPAAFDKLINPGVVWIARVHHLIPPPHQREGRVLVNVVSYLMQLVALFLIKHHADVVIALNSSLADELKIKGFTPVYTLGAGVDVAKIHVASSKKANKYDGIFVGRLHPSKGIYDLVPIWQQVIKTQPEATLVIIGEGDSFYKNQLRNQVQRANLKAHIKILGYQRDTDIYAYLKKAGFFLFTDHEAGWGLAVAEAMAAGLPVVGFDVGVLGDVFQKGFILVPKGDIARFADAITHLLRRPARIKELSLDAKSEVKQHSWVSVSARFLAIVKTTTHRTPI